MAIGSSAYIEVCEITGFWAMTPCCLVDEYRRYGGTFCCVSSSEKAPSTFYPENGGDISFFESVDTHVQPNVEPAM
jgi:hypothetical protein